MDWDGGGLKALPAVGDAAGGGLEAAPGVGDAAGGGLKAAPATPTWRFGHRGGFSAICSPWNWRNWAQAQFFTGLFPLKLKKLSGIGHREEVSWKCSPS